jgi:hypothetical protein
MSNYVQATFFAPKDALSSGNPLKVIKGVEVDAELSAISSALATKYDANSSAITGGTFIATASGAPTNGMFLPAANTLGFATNGTQRGQVNSAGNWLFSSPTSGATLQLSVSASPTALSVTDSTVTGTLQIASSSYLIGTSSAHSTSLITGGTTRFTITSAGAITAYETYLGINALKTNATQETTTSTGTLTGCTTAPTITVFLSRTGNHVTATWGELTATSNTNACSITGAIPAGYRPARNQQCAIQMANNGVDEIGVILIAGASADFLLTRGAGAAFTAAGTKGSRVASTITWMLD